MKTFVKGFLASVLGIVFFLAVLVAWIELTDPNRGLETEDSAISGTAGASGSGGVIATQTGTGTGTGAAPSTGTGNATGGAAVSSVAESVTDAYAGASASREAVMRDFLAIIEPEVRETFGNNVTVERSDMRIVISFWVDNLITDLSQAQVDDSTMNLWISTKEKADALCTTYYNQLAGFNISNAHITVNLLNERDRDKIILSYEDGRLVHDGLPDSHLRSQMERYTQADTSATSGGSN
ncbi:MAG: hypothetical protein IK016_08315 [Lachnospiraceae bacterium]|nr:hypothetical protein [Lachnospiraceae bacterium]